MGNANLLEIKKLSIAFIAKKTVKAVNNISFSLKKNEILGICGDSGSGKSVTCRAVMRLYNERIANITGEILFKGKDIYKMNLSELQNLRRKKISMIFQNPFGALDPFYTIKKQMIECQCVDDTGIENILKNVYLNPKEVLCKYPHELSGGMLQRVLIAMAILGRPEILICDEPTTALDVIVQKEIIDLLLELKEKNHMSIIFITHDKSLLKYMTDRVVFMEQGKVVKN